MSFAAAISAINIDFLYSGLPRIPGLGEEVFSANFDMQMGGGSPTSLITLKKLGVDSKLGTYLSNDNMGIMARMLLEKHDIDYKNLYKGNGNAINVTSIASFPEDRYFLSYFPGVDANLLDDDEVYSFLNGAKVAFCVDSHGDVMKKLKDEGTIIVYDIGWNDDLCIDNLKSILKNVNVFTPNDKEAMKMTGSTDIFEALDIIGSYVENVIITMGKNGCIAKSDKGIIYCPPVKGLKVIDTTGAGDNFLAGVAYGLYHGWPLEHCMKMGNAVGGYSTTSLGCCTADITIEKAIQLVNNMGHTIINPDKDILNF